MHSDYCGNCGRFSNLLPDVAIELSDLDVRCTEGVTPHAHSEEDKVERIEALYQAEIQ